MKRQCTLVIRTDANPQIGAGHLLRCLALAQAWAAVGRKVVICGQIESDHLRARVAAAGFEHVEPGPAAGDTVELLARRGLGNCWVVLDGYHFGAEWQIGLVNAGFLVAVIDDGARLVSYAAQVIVAPEQNARPSAYVASSSTLILTGSPFRLQRPGFADGGRPRRGADGNALILLCFGGADSANATRSAVLALKGVLQAQDRALVVLGPLNPHLASVQVALDEVGYGYELHQNVEDMAALFARADLAVSAAGGTAWELAAAGLPAILIRVAENQQPGMDYLEECGAAVGLGGPEAMLSPEFPALIRRLLNSSQDLAEMSAKGRRACDGKGAARVCKLLEALCGEPDAGEMTLRVAAAHDMEPIFRLANDSAVRRNSFSPEEISLAQHAQWYSARLASAATAFFVFELAGAVLALARFDLIGESAEVDVAVHPAFRGRGLGARILRESAPRAMARLGVRELRALVLEANSESRRCFARAGFVEQGLETVRGRRCARFVCTTSDMDACLG
jgi:UDP-2,4-diacetamido-2,4,6-trideoxy-beta-L-altropyranose hydrolase